MNWFEICALIFCGLVLLFSFIVLIRNYKVLRYRENIINKISQLNDIDLKNNQYTDWRWIEFEKISYDSMVYKFWRTFDSFYKDKIFLWGDEIERN